jgi:hypothetical protein
MVWNLSCPAVSHICNFILFPSSSIVLILKSIPVHQHRISLEHAVVIITDKSLLYWLYIDPEIFNRDEPIVDIKVVLKVSSAYRNNTQVFPTPLSPISSSLNKRSYALRCAPETPAGCPVLLDIFLQIR